MSLRLSGGYPTFVPLGQYTAPTGYRSNVSGILQAPELSFWNIEKK